MHVTKPVDMDELIATVASLTVRLGLGHAGLGAGLALRFRIAAQLPVLRAGRGGSEAAVNSKCSRARCPEHREERERIDARVGGADGPVQMRPGDPTGRADLADDVARGDALALAHFDRGEVGEHREQSEAVVDDDGVSRKVKGTSDDNPAGVRRMNRRPCRAEEVGAAVGVARLAVEDAARAERAVRRLGDRPHEGPAPEPLGRGRLPRRREQRRLALDTRLLGWGWRDERLVDLQPPCRERALFDDELVNGAGRSRGRRHGVAAGMNVEIDADERLPGPSPVRNAGTSRLKARICTESDPAGGTTVSTTSSPGRIERACAEMSIVRSSAAASDHITTATGQGQTVKELS